MKFKSNIVFLRISFFIGLALGGNIEEIDVRVDVERERERETYGKKTESAGKKDNITFGRINDLRARMIQKGQKCFFVYHSK